MLPFFIVFFVALFLTGVMELSSLDFLFKSNTFQPQNIKVKVNY